MDFQRKFGELKIFPELILSFSGHISILLTAARMPKLDAAWKKKLEIFYLPTPFFVHFFTIFHNLSGRGNVQINIKLHFLKKKEHSGSANHSNCAHFHFEEDMFFKTVPLATLKVD